MSSTSGGDNYTETELENWDQAGSSRKSQLISLLLHSCYEGDLNGFARALLFGVPVDATDPRTGLTALHIAVGTNNAHLTRALVEEHKAAFAPDSFGRWPSVIAVECGASDRLSSYIAEAERRFLGISEAE